MATDATRLGKAIVAALQGAGLYPDTSQDHVDESIARWEVIAGAILSEVTQNLEIDLSAGDIQVQPGSFTTPAGGPVTGQGIISAATLQGKLK